VCVCVCVRVCMSCGERERESTTDRLGHRQPCLPATCTVANQPNCCLWIRYPVYYLTNRPVALSAECDRHVHRHRPRTRPCVQPRTALVPARFAALTLASHSERAISRQLSPLTWDGSCGRAPSTVVRVGASVCVCVRVCLCVCVRERETEGEREGGREMKRDAPRCGR
jgi:hypothetical protein